VTKSRRPQGRPTWRAYGQSVLTTASAILSSIALLLPGFLIAEISTARSARGSRSDLELALRSLSYALIVHVIFGFWTVHLISTVGKPDEWPDHWGALTAYGLMVIFAVPVLIGSIMNRYLAQVDASGAEPSLLAATLGAGPPSDAFDFSQHSAAGRTPSPHDVFLERLCTVVVDANGIRSLADQLEPPRAVYIPAEQIVRIDFLTAETSATVKT
jgi:hypothetical protein